jgi:hypothetical protein
MLCKKIMFACTKVMEQDNNANRHFQCYSKERFVGPALLGKPL